MLPTGLSLFLPGDFHQEFPPETPLAGDSSNSGEAGDQFTRGTDVLHPEFINYMKASGGSTDCLTYFLLFGSGFHLAP